VKHSTCALLLFVFSVICATVSASPRSLSPGSLVQVWVDIGIFDTSQSPAGRRDSVTVFTGEILLIGAFKESDPRQREGVAYLRRNAKQLRMKLHCRSTAKQEAVHRVFLTAGRPAPKKLRVLLDVSRDYQGRTLVSIIDVGPLSAGTRQMGEGSGTTRQMGDGTTTDRQMNDGSGSTRQMGEHPNTRSQMGEGEGGTPQMQ
jgi:hypothetical protein